MVGVAECVKHFLHREASAGKTFCRWAKKFLSLLMHDSLAHHRI
jgi:hypothetical protein